MKSPSPDSLKLAKEFDYDYIDLHSLMTDEKGELKKELTADGLHINARGQHKRFAAARKCLLRLRRES